MAYVMLLGAILSEVVASTFLRLSKGFESLGYGAVSIFWFSVSLYCLSKAIKVVPLSVAYSLWAGLGIAGTLLVGYLIFDENIGFQQIAGTVLILVGAVVVRASAA